jgi:hypothetical protein
MAMIAAATMPNRNLRIARSSIQLPQAGSQVRPVAPALHNILFATGVRLVSIRLMSVKTTPNPGPLIPGEVHYLARSLGCKYL